LGLIKAGDDRDRCQSALLARTEDGIGDDLGEVWVVGVRSAKQGQAVFKLPQ
jgi:hypothetical protein